MPKTWNDQPYELIGLEVLSNIRLHNGCSCEVRRGRAAWYLTHGNLFGSQTFKCSSSDLIFFLIDHASGENVINTLPLGIEVLCNG